MKAWWCMTIKKIFKTCVRNEAFKQLDYFKEGHSEVEHTYYSNFNHPQGYILSK